MKFDFTSGIHVDIHYDEVEITGYNIEDVMEKLISEYGVGKIIECLGTDEDILEYLDREEIELFLNGA